MALLDYRLANNETSEPVASALSARGIPFVLATGMAPDHLPAVFRTGVMLTKPYLTAELNAAWNARCRPHRSPADAFAHAASVWA